MGPQERTMDPFRRSRILTKVAALPPPTPTSQPQGANLVGEGIDKFVKGVSELPRVVGGGLHRAGDLLNGLHRAGDFLKMEGTTLGRAAPHLLAPNEQTTGVSRENAWNYVKDENRNFFNPPAPGQPRIPYGHWSPLRGREVDLPLRGTALSEGKTQKGWQIDMDQAGTGHPWSGMTFEQLNQFLGGLGAGRSAWAQRNPNNNLVTTVPYQTPETTGSSLGDKILDRVRSNEARNIGFGLSYSKERTGGKAVPQPEGTEDCTGFMCGALGLPKKNSDQLVRIAEGKVRDPNWRRVMRPEDIRIGDVGAYPRYVISEEEGRRRLPGIPYDPRNPRFTSYGHGFGIVGFETARNQPDGSVNPMYGMPVIADNSLAMGRARVRTWDTSMAGHGHAPIRFVRANLPNLLTGPSPEYNIDRMTVIPARGTAGRGANR